MLSPDGDRRARSADRRLLADETARGLLFVERRRSGSRPASPRERDTLAWFGKRGRAGRPRRASIELGLRARDPAGNLRDATGAGRRSRCATSRSAAIASSRRRAPDSRFASRRTRGGSAGRSDGEAASRDRGRCGFVRRSRRAGTRCASRRTVTRRRRRSSSASRCDERARPDRGNDRLPRARAAPPRAASGAAARGARRLGARRSPASPPISRRRVERDCCSRPRPSAACSPLPAPPCSCAGRGCCRSRRSRACRSGFPSRSAARRRTCSCRSTASSARSRSALGWQLVRGDERSRELGPVALPLAALVAWTGLSLLWTDDLRQGAIFLLAFVLPFGLLAIGFARLPWSRTGVLVALYGALARDRARLRRDRALPVGDARRLLEPDRDRRATRTRRSTASTRSSTTRRSTGATSSSRSWRRSASSCSGCAGGCSRAPSRRSRRSGSGCSSRSPSPASPRWSRACSSAATVVWRWRAAAAAGFVAVVLLSVGFATPQVRTTLLKESRAGLNNATSGRANLVTNGIRIAADHPLAGVGVGSFKRAYADRTGLKGREPRKAASHSTPVTVAAEIGHPRPPAPRSGSAWPRWARRCSARTDTMPVAPRSPWGLRLARSPCTASSTTRSSRIR